MFSKVLILLGLLAVLVLAYAKDEEVSESSSIHAPKLLKLEEEVGKRHPRNVRTKRTVSLPKDKYDAILKIYSAPGDLADKNKEADKLSEDYSADEKKVVEKIKKFFAKRADVLKNLSKDTIETLKTIRELRKKQKDAFNTIAKSEQKDASFIIFGVAPHDLSENVHKEVKA